MNLSSSISSPVSSRDARGVFTDGDSVLSMNAKDSKSRRRTVNGENERWQKFKDQLIGRRSIGGVIMRLKDRDRTLFTESE
jgi:hypothetical protein